MSKTLYPFNYQIIDRPFVNAFYPSGGYLLLNHFRDENCQVPDIKAGESVHFSFTSSDKPELAKVNFAMIFA